MDATRPALRAQSLIGQGLRDIFRAPFLLLVALSVFVYVVSETVSRRADDTTLLFAILLSVVSAYAQIACILAAATADPARSADAWFVAALRRRCFWRFVLAELVTLLLVVAGLFVVVVGAFVVGGITALAQTAAVLERTGPIQSVKRSAALGRDERRTLAVVFGVLVLLPGVGLQAAYQLGIPEKMGATWLAASLPGVLLMLAGTIALARAFVHLGGSPASQQHPASRRAD